MSAMTGILDEKWVDTKHISIDSPSMETAHAADMWYAADPELFPASEARNTPLLQQLMNKQK
jgi:hypothetical protein